MADKKKYKTKWIVSRIILLIIFCMGCNLTNLVKSSGVVEKSTSQIIGINGGEMNGPGGVKIIIPEGALLGDTSFTIVEDPNPPAAPDTLTSMSSTYTINIENDSPLVKSVELIIPITRTSEIPDDCVSVYRWNNNEWEPVGGNVEGDAIVVDVLHFSTYEAKACSQSEHRPLLFIDLTPKALPDYRYTGITPWDATLVDETCGGQIRRLYSDVKLSGTNGDFTWGSQTFPWGEYHRWCVTWSEADLNSNLMIRYHMYIDTSIILDELSCKLGDWRAGLCEPEKIYYTLPGFGGGIRGDCGEDEGQSGIIGSISQSASRTPGSVAATMTATPTQSSTSTSTPSITATPGIKTLTVRTYIDGRSQVIIHGKSVYFYHLEYAAPGVGYARPNYINGAEWYPTWPEPAPSYNRDCNCYSSENNNIDPLARQNQTVSLSVIESRDPDGIVILQQPDSSNDYKLILEIYDYSAGGGWYEFTLSYLSSN